MQKNSKEASEEILLEKTPRINKLRSTNAANHHKKNPFQKMKNFSSRSKRKRMVDKTRIIEKEENYNFEIKNFDRFFEKTSNLKKFNLGLGYSSEVEFSEKLHIEAQKYLD